MTRKSWKADTENYRTGMQGMLLDMSPEYWEILSGIPLRLQDVEAYHGQVHSACRGALNLVTKAGCQEGVRGVSYSLDI